MAAFRHRFVLWTVAVLWSACGPRREQLVVQVDDTDCQPGCTASAYEVYVLLDDEQGPCIRRAMRTIGQTDHVFADLDLSEGQRYGLGVASFCQGDLCPRCAGTGFGTAKEGGDVQLKLAQAAECTFGIERVCQPQLLWLSSAAGKLSGRMARGPAHGEGALAGDPIYPDMNQTNAPRDQRVELLPTDDAYIRAGQYADKKHGPEKRIIITTSSLLDYQREGLFRFALEGLAAGSSHRGLLRLYGGFGTETSQTCELAVHAVAIDTWSEGSVTYNTAPATGAPLDTRTMPHQDWIELDVTRHITSQLMDDRVASFRVVSDRKDYLHIRSKEDDVEAHWPELWIYQAIGLESDQDAASFEFETTEPWRWFLWARLYYPGTTAAPTSHPNSFWVTVDDGPPQQLGGREDKDGRWHWDGFGASPASLGFLKAGRHTLKIINRESLETADDALSPRLDVLLLTNEPAFQPTDSAVRLDASTP